MVVLHADERQYAFELPGVAGREVVGMEVVGDDLGDDAEKPLVEVDGCSEVIESVQVFEVAYVLAEEGELIAGEAECVLLLGADGENGSCPEGELHRVRGIAPRPPDRFSARRSRTRETLSSYREWMSLLWTRK